MPVKLGGKKTHHNGKEVDHDNNKQANGNPHGAIDIFTDLPVDNCRAANLGVVVAEADCVGKRDDLGGSEDGIREPVELATAGTSWSFLTSRSSRRRNQRPDQGSDVETP